MQILVWRGYGRTSAHAAETLEQTKKILGLVKDETAIWRVAELDEELAKIDQALEQAVRDAAWLRRRIASLVSDQCGGTDSFEVFEFTKVENMDKQ